MKQLLKNIFFESKRDKHIEKLFRNSSFTILDVGSGNNAVKFFKSKFPHCQYYGIDRVPNYNNDLDCIELMDKFFQIDLTSLKFGDIPNNFFDFVNLTHVIEHLYNGDKVIENLLPKIKEGGYIYIEFPDFQSTKLPSMKNTLNFFDDPTHIRIFSLREIYNLLLRNEFKIINGGIKRNFVYLIILPIELIRRKIKRGYCEGGDFWDLFGFAKYVIAQKNKNSVG